VADQSFRILIVDDTEDIRELLCLRLEAEGYEARAAANGETGLDIARQWQPDLILLDLMMPGMDGYEVCRHLKALPATRRTPVIFLTARTDVTDRVKGLSHGAVDYISKPFDSRELLARVQVALRAKQTMDDLEQSNQQLQVASVTDSLSGLFNRRYFEERLSDELNDCAHRGVTAACLILDLDHLKLVNDTHGHLGGDAVIRQFAELIRALTRRGDVAARFGGDEFAILLAGVTPRGALAAAEKIRAAVEQTPFDANGARVWTTTSIGLTCFPLGQQTRVDQVIDQADRALYRAKTTRNRVEASPESAA
jgi:diguanylate cyclase (GGDEF)-like protein